MRRLLTSVLIAVSVLAAAAGAAGWYGWRLYAGPGPLTADTTVVVPRGSGVQAIARQLADAGVVRAPEHLLIAARLTDQGRRLKAGEYAIPAGASLRAVLDLVESGRTVVRRLTVPEGLTSTEIVGLLLAEPALAGEVGAVPPEGTLLPETYHFSLGDSRAELLERMRRAMAEALAELWPGRADGLPLTTPEQAVVLASIVEKETGVAAERSKVAGVFVNRLRIGMRLQSDPTVIFALTEGKRPMERLLTRADWQVESPYNTYAVAGLPPGPIANPGRASLAAVLNPDSHGYFYFVADGTGGHAFATSLDQHNRNVAQWRRVQRERAEAEPGSGG